MESGEKEKAVTPSPQLTNLHNVCGVSGRHLILYFLNIVIFASFRRKTDPLLFLPPFAAGGTGTVLRSPL